MAGALPVASAIILLPFYIAYLPTATYGTLSICLAFSLLVQVVTIFSFDTSLHVHYQEFRKDTQTLHRLVSSVFLFLLGFGAIILVASALAGAPIFELIFAQQSFSFYPYGFVSVGIGVFQAIFKVKGYLLQTQERPQIFLWSNVVSFAIICVTTIIGLWLFPDSLIGPLGGRLVAAVLSALWALWHTFRETGIHFKSPWRYTSFSYNAYMFAYSLQHWASGYLDRFIIMFFLPLSTVGIYDFAMKCLVPIDLVINGLRASFTPSVIRHINDQQIKSATPEINRYFYGLIAITLLMVCFSIFGIPVLVEVFVQKSGYAEALPFIPYLALIFIFRALRPYFVVPFTVLKEMRPVMWINVGTTILRVGSMVVLIEYLDLAGIIIAAYLVMVVEIALLWRYLANYYVIRFNTFKLIGLPAAVFIMVIVGEYFVDDSFDLMLHASYGMVSVALLFLAYRKELDLLTPRKLFK